MGEDGLKCSVAECKVRFKEVDSMGLSQLEAYATKCATCGNWFLKDHKVAQETYQKVSLTWAEAFNKAHIKHALM